MQASPGTRVATRLRNVQNCKFTQSSVFLNDCAILAYTSTSILRSGHLLSGIILFSISLLLPNPLLGELRKHSTIRLAKTAHVLPISMQTQWLAYCCSLLKGHLLCLSQRGIAQTQCARWPANLRRRASVRSTTDNPLPGYYNCT